MPSSDPDHSPALWFPLECYSAFFITTRSAPLSLPTVSLLAPTTNMPKLMVVFPISVNDHPYQLSKQDTRYSLQPYYCYPTAEIILCKMLIWPYYSQLKIFNGFPLVNGFLSLTCKILHVLVLNPVPYPQPQPFLGSCYLMHSGHAGLLSAPLTHVVPSCSQHWSI